MEHKTRIVVNKKGNQMTGVTLRTNKGRIVKINKDLQSQSTEKVPIFSSAEANASTKTAILTSAEQAMTRKTNMKVLHNTFERLENLAGIQREKTQSSLKKTNFTMSMT